MGIIWERGRDAAWMTEVRRPAPRQPAHERWRQALFGRRVVASLATSLRPPQRTRPRSSASVTGGALVGLSLALGALFVIAAAGFALTSWRGRSSVPLDDQLPYLLGADNLAAAEESVGAAPPPEVATPAATSVASASELATVPASEPLGVSGSSGGEADDDPTGSGSVERVVVHVSGAVGNPGVVELGGGARVHHAVAAAGGATEQADLERVNLAAVLVDGERIHVPEIGDHELPTIVAPSRIAEPSMLAGTSDDLADVRVDINRASVAELEELPGIGPSIARAILDLRTARGAYASVDELLLVDGIGPTKLETLRPHALVTG